MHHIPSFSGFNDKSCSGTDAFSRQSLIYGRHAKKSRDGRECFRQAPVAEYKEGIALGQGFLTLFPHLFDGQLQLVPGPVGGKSHGQGLCPKVLDLEVS